MDMDSADEPWCSIERSLRVLEPRWTLLIVREIFAGKHRFTEIQASLGISSNLLSVRLKALIDIGVLDKLTYREPGSRPRDGYHLTPAGEELLIILGALQQWGDRHRPHPAGPARLRRERATGNPVHIGFIVGTDGREIPWDEVEFLHPFDAPDV
ncbi:helix-turn-helix domain-containing protein [Nocardia sp. NPDC005825]|uniref:winged helix-turn-helix transcriptional regulator n=1 Tax=unclassified Nocardia TaxID=2637762 RepID=UPI0033E2DF70